jgi:epsilon-lactone hydrolase
MAVGMHPPREVIVESEQVGGVNGDWLIPQNAPDNPVMMFLHGGGILFGWSAPQRRMLGYLSQFAGLRAFGVDYRLVPEAVYPAAHDDSFAVYQALVNAGKRVVIVGESSGGVLALATLLRIKAAGLPQPSVCALISPTVDYGFQDKRIWTASDAFVPPGFVVEMHKHYIAGNDAMLPDLAPLYTDLSGIAPLIVLTGEYELLRGETERLSDAARAHGVALDVLLWPQVWHGWHLLAPQLPEATQALKTLGKKIRATLI